MLSDGDRVLQQSEVTEHADAATRKLERNVTERCSAHVPLEKRGYL